MKQLVYIALIEVTLLAGTALAAPLAQVSCDVARVKAWTSYASCVNRQVALTATSGGGAYSIPKMIRCRHKYYSNWTNFQTTLRGTTCNGSRFTDNGDGTVTDNLTTLVWEKKDNLDGTVNPIDPHDADNTYLWSTGAPWNGTGSAFTDFLETLNAGGGFAGANDWRLPTLAELQTIVLDFSCQGSYGIGNSHCICQADPCVDPALDASNTQATFYGRYWSVTTTLYPYYAWVVAFDGWVYTGMKDGSHVGLPGPPPPVYVRAVRGGLGL